MNHIAKVCIAAGSSLGVCTTAPAWVTVTVVAIVATSVVIVAKETKL
jgi:hypothetical protein